MTKGVQIETVEGKRVVKGLGYYETPDIENLKHLVKRSADRYGNAVAFRFKDINGNITGKTYIEFDRDIDCLGTALISLGLKGMRYSIIGENRYEWGSVTLPLRTEAALLYRLTNTFLKMKLKR